MSQRLLGMLVAIAFAILTPYVNAGTQHGCGQVANPVVIAMADLLLIPQPTVVPPLAMIVVARKCDL